MKSKNEKLMRKNSLFLAVCLAFSCSAGTILAKDDDAALEKLGAFKRTDAPPMKSVPQEASTQRT